ncbi:MAG: hypothetical protein U5L04_16865 [Trueperaceae bacterium]|nr:hypothetical protein [Trueperaceae bacterium]
MSDIYLLSALTPKQTLHGAIEKLLTLSLSADRYPDKYIAPFWSFRAADHVTEEAFDTLWDMSTSSGVSVSPESTQGQERTVLSFNVGHPPEGGYVYSSGFGYASITLSLFPEDQKLVVDSEDVLLRIYYAYSGSKIVPASASVPSRLLAQKVLEVLQPKYAFSTTEEDLNELRTPLDQPWQTYAPTMVFGVKLAEELRLDHLTARLREHCFYVQVLKGPIYWLADPTGIGNEWPAKLMIDTPGAALPLNFIEPSLSNFYRQINKRHADAVAELLT